MEVRIFFGDSAIPQDVLLLYTRSFVLVNVGRKKISSLSQPQQRGLVLS